jgi:transcriptional regulator with GAF, ATPase, and Fis domain
MHDVIKFHELDISRGIDFQAEVRRFEIELITRALKLSKGKQSKAAQLLGLKHTTLHYKIKQLKLRMEKETIDPSKSE